MKLLHVLNIQNVVPLMNLYVSNIKKLWFPNEMIIYFKYIFKMLTHLKYFGSATKLFYVLNIQNILPSQ